MATVAASIDGMTKETYEKIRVPAKWERLLACLDTLCRVRTAARSKTPRLRIIFTWMRSNRKDLQLLPEFAADHGATEIDVRFVSQTPGVDVTPELLTDDDPAELNAELVGGRARCRAARSQARLVSPVRDGPRPTRDSSPATRRRLWRLRAGLDRPEYWRYSWYQGLFGCAYPDRNYVIRPNGAVSPCIYWEQDPIGFYPADNLERIAGGAPLEAHPRRTAHGQADRHLRDLRRAAHRALPAARHAGARDGRAGRLPTHPGR